MVGRKDEISVTSGLQIPLSKSLHPPKKPKTNYFAFLCAIVASMSSVLVGYDIGVMSEAVIYIQQDFNISDVRWKFLSESSAFTPLSAPPSLV
ncbi:unnamed protein product [Citrullus colocynthis]|uniref:Major facilitator superfamily (MFS) profile domain-containing protein n=1 Tax=Citrullus colocynthis TaxID=252529 RepID=A0ABP0Y9Q4_9ROSI